jgi:hypothetical protein
MEERRFWALLSMAQVPARRTPTTGHDNGDTPGAKERSVKRNRKVIAENAQLTSDI